MPDAIERAAAAGFSVLPAPDKERYFYFERDGFIAIAERSGDRIGPPGSPGILTERGFAVLIWSGTEAFFVAKNFKQRATEEQVTKLRQFSADLAESLR